MGIMPVTILPIIFIALYQVDLAHSSSLETPCAPLKSSIYSHYHLTGR